MTAEEFKKYEGKRTFGMKDEFNLYDGIIVGYKLGDNNRLIAGFYHDLYWDEPASEDVLQCGKEKFKSFIYVGIENVIMTDLEEVKISNEELNLTEILKGCEGVKLFSEVFGVCEIHRVNDFVCMKSEKGYLHYFNPDGRLNYFTNCNCLLWPSETNRDWSTFKKPVKVNDDDWVVACDGEGRSAIVSKYGKLSEKCKYVIPFEKYNPNLTTEELKKLSIV